jgi:hypothetical protein
MARKLDPKSKAGFVRSQPESMSPDEVIEAGKNVGIELDVRAVHAARRAAKKARAGADTAKLRRSAEGEIDVATGIRSEIERIVEAKVADVLKKKLGGLVG